MSSQGAQLSQNLMHDPLGPILGNCKALPGRSHGGKPSSPHQFSGVSCNERLSPPPTTSWASHHLYENLLLWIFSYPFKHLFKKSTLSATICQLPVLSTEGSVMGWTFSCSDSYVEALKHSISGCERIR